MFSRETIYDYYWPTLSTIGEQAVKNKEIYAQGTADDELTFGYQERYAEYRYKPSSVTGNSVLTQPELWSPGTTPRNTHHYRYLEIPGYR